ncbi:cysteinyl leukotriene receptor 2-like [Xiphophorus hellerii]|uniref:cysteinyl leukotriene receptor 2-like n=1 Tax=Xiphophorus hellerii TaxID=8084 RepID=UPI0013B438BC|nr:cysteinyl leukotriene receptor 2-like [Xiphophorus hellerii]
MAGPDRNRTGTWMKELQAEPAPRLEEWLAGNTTAPNSSINTRTCPHDDDEFKYNAYILTYFLVFPVAFLCNILALVVFFRQKKRRRKPAYVIMVNLALSDGSFSLTLPLRLAYYMNKGHWSFPDWVCRLCVYTFYVNLYSSILFLTFLSLLRWFSIVYPLHHKKVKSFKLALLTCLGIWLFVAVSSLPFLGSGVNKRGGIPRCFEPATPQSWSRILSMNYVALIFGFVLPFFTIILCCTKIIHCLTHPPYSQDPKTRMKLRKKNQRSVHLLIMVIATFLLCFLPYHVIRTLHLYAVNGGWNCGVTNLLQRAVAITLCMAASNSVVNPLLYYYSTKNFKEDIEHTRLHISKRLSFRSGSLRSTGRAGSLKVKTQQGLSIKAEDMEQSPLKTQHPATDQQIQMTEKPLGLEETCD